MFSGNVLVTGGSGFLGRGIMRRAKCEGWDCQFTVYSRDETKQDNCRRSFPDANYVLGDIRDENRLLMALHQYNVDMIVHAGAIKYVPDAEFNVSETIDVNIGGWHNVLRASVIHGVTNVIYISTDKACRPVNVYGMTKSIGERLMSEYAKAYNDIKFVGTRYGNVIGSTGSVVPFFDLTVRNGNRIQITDANMSRFWMSINEAVDCILEALDGDSGTLCIPKCKAMTIGDVARSIMQYNGHRDNEFDLVGVRPGEKTFEELVHAQESQRCVDGGRYYYTLYPVGRTQSSLPHFNYVSDHPHEWMQTDELLSSYEDSRCL